MAFAGEIYAFLTAVIWAGVAFLYARAAERRLAMVPFVAVITTTASILALMIFTRTSVILEQGAGWPLITVMIVCGITAQFGMLYGGRAMTAIPSKSSVAWFVLQMAMVITFLGSVLLWHERAALHRWLALPLLALALLLVMPAASAQPDHDRTRIVRWTGLLLWGFVLSGIGQLLSQVPSVYGWNDAANIRVPLSLGAAAVVLWGVCGITGQWPRREHWKLGLLAGLVVMSGNVTLYKALDLLAPTGEAHLVYPVAVGGSVVLFTIAQTIAGKEAMSLKTGAGILVGTMGLVLLAWQR